MTVASTTKTSAVGLTGGQLFGRARPGSDFDFYAQDSAEARAWLMSEGYRSLPILRCGDNIVAVYRIGNGHGNIDVALCRSYDRKHLHNRLMALTPFRLVQSFAPKKIRTSFWRVIQRL